MASVPTTTCSGDFPLTMFCFRPLCSHISRLSYSLSTLQCRTALRAAGKDPQSRLAIEAMMKAKQATAERQPPRRG